MLAASMPTFVFAAQVIELPKHPEKVGVDLVTALELRKTTREFAPGKLATEDLSAILWAANGVNRPDGKRTAPTAHGKQYIDIYLAGGDGIYLYDAPNHVLKLVKNGNEKTRLAHQKHVGEASYVLVLIADMTKMDKSFGNNETKLNFANATAGTIAQNVALMCAAKSIGTGVVASIEENYIRRALNLTKQQVPLYVMPLGYMKK